MSVPILDIDKVRETIEKLGERIQQRFPGSGLLRVCGQLGAIAAQTAERSRKINEPIWPIRLVGWVLVTLLTLVMLVLPWVLAGGFSGEELTLKYFVEIGDPVLNEIVIVGALVFFLFTLEKRFKRHRALKAVHELRSIAHVIDMHQLTKDPDRVTSKVFIETENSPKPQLDRFQLRRYLDYFSEMLSLTGKLAAVYVQHFDDGVALSAVNEVESLTTGLSRKIWQKIMILHGAPETNES